MCNHDQDSVDLSKKLQKLKLKPRQMDLLKAMLGVARGITDDTNGHEVPNLKNDFATAFDPLPKDRVEMLLAYSSTPPMIVQHEEVVQALGADGSVGKPEKPYALPPRIHWDPEP